MGGYTFLEIGGVTKNGGDELRMGGMKVVAHYEYRQQVNKVCKV